MPLTQELHAPVCQLGVQEVEQVWLSVGLPVVVPQLFQSVQARVCKPLMQELQLLQVQLGVQPEGVVGGVGVAAQP